MTLVAAATRVQPFIPQVLPAPRPWVGLVYLIPGLIGIAFALIRLKRAQLYPEEERGKAFRTSLQLLALFILLTSVTGSLVQWGFQ